MFWWLLITLIVAIVVYKLYKPHQYWKEKGILYIKPWPIIGNMVKFPFRIQSMADWVESMYNAYDARYIGIYQFLDPTLMIKDIDLLKQIAIKDFDYFIDRRMTISEEVEPIFGKNLAALKGQKWRDMRATLSPAFTSSKMRLMYVLISECAEQFVNHFAKMADTKKPLVVEMKDVYTRYTNDVIATCAFGIKCDSLENKNNEFYLFGKDATSITGLKNIKFTLLITVPWLMNKLNVKFNSPEVTQYFQNIVSNTIKTREKHNILRPDMIHLLMEARKGKLKYEEPTKNSDDGFATVEESQVGTNVKYDRSPLTDDDITAQAFLFFFAGFETSSTLLAFLSHELAVNPEVQKKLHEEVDSTLEESEGKLSYETVLKMKYLDMVVCEILRKWPPGSVFDRVCVKPYTIQPTNSNEKPLYLDKGCSIMIPLYAIHRDPKYFPNPDKFDPERFSDENKGNIKPFSYIPFGIGPRNCIASRFALLECKALIVHLLSKFEIVVVDKTTIPLVLSKASFNMAAKNGHWLGLKLRTK